MNVKIDAMTALNNKKTEIEWAMDSLSKTVRAEAKVLGDVVDTLMHRVPGIDTQERVLTLSDVGLIEAEIDSLLAHVKKLQTTLNVVAGENRKLDMINFAREQFVANAGPSSVQYHVAYITHYQKDINTKVKRDKNTISVLVTDLGEACDKAIDTIHSVYEKYDNYSAEVRVWRTNTAGQTEEIKEFNLEWDATEGEKRPEINY